MNKIVQKLGIATLVLVLSLSAVACSSSSGDQAKEKITVGTDSSFVPFEFLNEETNEYDGFDIDLVKALSKEVGFEYELKTMDFNGLIPALQTNKLDMAIAGMTIKEERKKVVDFSQPYYDAGLLILVQKDEKEIKGLEDLKGKKIATKQGTTSYDFATNIDGVKEVVPFPNIDQAYLELEKGAADAVIFDSPNVLYYSQNKGKGKVKTVGKLLQGQQYGIAFPKGSELRDKVDKAMTKLKEDGTYDKLYKKWFGEAPPQ
ncbi:glutamine transport system substrate-binding protein [Melghirimyces profundicolus]|uniref:Glutamine transport system substrate-binding protein n=1 Tax=Melghirimyces profundicolus TaxID=1242148 RepID=A0A2T6C0I2_9BACL|nr:glutamine ABC transporter substrate-binding protein GlnH [Melghirimyces profundicolus]PTX61812.1 glutamine transport system substrate-binding protein [Melghirimyces profundicolus]